MELAGWELAAASRYGWRETKLRLALHLALLSAEQQEENDEDGSHVDNDNDWFIQLIICFIGMVAE